MSIKKLWQEFASWWKSTSLGTEIDNAGEATKNELEAVAPEILEAAASTTSATLLTAISAGSPVAAIMSEGVAAAEAAFKAASTSVSATALTTFTAALHSSVTAQQAAGAVTPAPAGATGAANEA